METKKKPDDQRESTGTLCYVAILRTWPQTGPESSDLHLVTRVLKGDETIDELMAWAAPYYANVTITKAT